MAETTEVTWSAVEAADFDPTREKVPETILEEAVAPRRVLSTVKPASRSGEIIARLASSRACVAHDAQIEDLAAAMDRDQGIFAVGVVDESGAPVGLVLRKELFDVLGKPFGRDLYRRRPVSSVMKHKPRTFRDDLSILAVSDMITEDLRGRSSTYYLLVDYAGKFTGIFSTRNVLIYLSDITARDLALARRIQSAIVLEKMTHRGARLHIACTSSMAKEVGGDFYIVKPILGGRLLVAICDVSGKGIAASLITAVLGGIFDSYVAAGQLKSFVRSLNRSIHDTFRIEFFVTAIIMEVDEANGEAVICDLGHSYMLVLEGTTLLKLGSGASNPPLGVDPDLSPVTRLYRMKPDSLTMLFTDGLVEQTDSGGAEYSEQRVWERMKESHGKSPEEVSREIADDLAVFRGPEAPRDDVTYMLMRFA